MKHITHITNSILVGVILVMAVFSCRRPSIDAELFEASLELAQTSVKDGDDFSFRIHCNYDSFKVSRLDCPFETDVIEEGGTYRVEDKGYAVFTIQKVEIPVSKKMSISMTVTDPTTGASVKLKESFVGYQSDVVSVKLDCGTVTQAQTEISEKGIPLVVGGSTVKMTINSSYDVLKVESFECAFNRNTLKEGMLLEFDKNGDCELVFENVSVQDNYSKPQELKLVLSSPYGAFVGTIESVPMEYLTIRPFECSLEILTPTVVNGGKFEAVLRSNRNKVYMTGVSSAYFRTMGTGNSGEGVFFDEITAQAEQELKITNGELHLSATVSSEKDIDDNLSFELSDRYYTSENTKKTVSGKWSLQVKKAASSIAIDKTSIVLDKGENEKYPTSASVRITTKDSAANGEYSWFEKSGKDDKITVEITKDDTGTGATAKVTAKEEGPYTVVFHPTGRKDVSVDLPVMVRYVVGLRIDEKGEYRYFKDYGECVHMSTNDEDKSWNTWQTRYRFGLIGFPVSITASLVTWKQTEDKLTEIAASEANNVTLQPFSHDCGNFSVNTIFESQNAVTSPYFYGPLYQKDPSHWQNYYLESEGSDWLLREHRSCIANELGSIKGTFPVESNKVHSITETTSQKTDKTLELQNAVAYMQQISALANIMNQTSGWNGGSSAGTMSKLNKPNFGKVKFEVNKISYDETKLNIKYIFYPARIASRDVSYSYNGTYTFAQKNLMYESSLPWWRNLYNETDGVDHIGWERNYDATPEKWVVEY